MLKIFVLLCAPLLCWILLFLFSMSIKSQIHGKDLFGFPSRLCTCAADPVWAGYNCVWSMQGLLLNVAFVLVMYIAFFWILYIRKMQKANDSEKKTFASHARRAAWKLFAFWLLIAVSVYFWVGRFKIQNLEKVNFDVIEYWTEDSLPGSVKQAFAFIDSIQYERVWETSKGSGKIRYTNESELQLAADSFGLVPRNFHIYNGKVAAIELKTKEIESVWDLSYSEAHFYKRVFINGNGLFVRFNNSQVLLLPTLGAVVREEGIFYLQISDSRIPYLRIELSKVKGAGKKLYAIYKTQIGT